MGRVGVCMVCACVSEEHEVCILCACVSEEHVLFLSVVQCHGGLADSTRFLSGFSQVRPFFFLSLFFLLMQILGISTKVR